MRRVFFDPDAPYHALRRAFVRKERPDRTPPHLVTGMAAHEITPSPDGC
jgi:putative two-component system hydrogenase maturation factor HypX/HoxX